MISRGLSIFVVCGLSILCWTEADSATVWTGPRRAFSRVDFADYTQPANQDRITQGIWLTRGNSAGLFNICKELEYDSSLSPKNTEWAYGSTTNYQSLSFTTWGVWSRSLGGMTTNIIGHDAVVHLIPEDVYIDIKFTAFTGGGDGGGFAYERAGSVALSLRGPALTSVSRFGVFIDPGAAASNSAGVPLSVMASGVVDTTTPGDYILTYSASDSLGFVAATNRLVSVLETNSAPSWWLSRYNLETNEVTSLLDSDEDGMANWCEYLSGTDPTNKVSALRVSASSEGMILAWPGVAGRVYSVYQTTNLAVSFSLAPGGSNLTANPQGNTYTNTEVPLPPARFFKISVQLPDP